MKSRSQIQNVTLLLILAVFFLSIPAFPVFSQEKKPVTIEDYGRWKVLEKEKISDNGVWLVYILNPNEGNNTLVAKNLENGTVYKKNRADDPIISGNSKWVAYKILPEDSLSDKEKKKAKNNMGFINLTTGETTEIDSVESFTFSDDGSWLIYKLSEKEEKDSEKNKNKEEKKVKVGTTLILKNLETGKSNKIDYVKNYTMDEDSKYLVYSVANKDMTKDGLFARKLKEGGETICLLEGPGEYKEYSWSEDNKKLAMVSNKDDWESDIPLFDLFIWNTEDNKIKKVVESRTAVFPQNMVVSEYGNLKWSETGEKLFFGIAPKKEKELTEVEKQKLPDVDIWHWKDVRLQPQQKIQASRDKKKSFTAVYHTDSKKTVPLGSENFETIIPSPDGENAIAVTQKSYFEKMPWRFPNFRDYYLMNTETIDRNKFLKKALWNGKWSPNSRYILYYHNRDWWLYDAKKKKGRNLTKDIDVAFWQVEDDHPDTKRPYGWGLWLKDDKGVLLYDKYDIWMFPVKEHKKPVNITKEIGRKNDCQFKYVQLDEDEKFVDPDKEIILSFFNNKTKASGYYKLKIGNEPEELIKMDKRISSLQKAKNTYKYILRIQTFEEYPDVYVTDKNFDNIEKVTDANPQQKEYAWGKNELIEWLSMDGKPLQGILTYPAGYKPGKKYPMVVYIYERLSNWLHVHYIPLANHRFNASVYASNGYAVFKPDIVYDIGHPGMSSVKCILPGIQKIIEMGIADPKRIGLQGHSWGGYETAYIITQTDIFAAAVSGAPVSNMTSAYGGIRWGSGLSRQFQYERTQSRIGGSLWEYPELYIENSPLFFCNQVNTPLLILHGDEDGAVPWYQGIELFVGLRRLNKKAIMLQYNNEPHHLKKKKNKYDFTRRMWEFYEHYLRDKPAPEWMKEGVPFLEKGTK